jgi:hypothetical protein
LCLAFIVAAIAVARSQDNGRVTGIASPAPIVSTQAPARRPD